MIRLTHRCGFVTEHRSLGELLLDVRAMYEGAEVDGRRNLVWDKDGVVGEFARGAQ
jgi:hypothetical protein